MAQVFTGKDLVTGDPVNRWIEGAGIVLGLVPGGKALLKGNKILKLGAEVTKRARQLGKAGEDAVKAVYDIGEKAKVVINGRVRFPDGLTQGVISEVKNVANLSFTRQLRDYLDYVLSEGFRFDLYTRLETKLSGPLQDAIDSGLINRLYIPE